MSEGLGVIEVDDEWEMVAELRPGFVKEDVDRTERQRVMQKAVVDVKRLPCVVLKVVGWFGLLIEPFERVFVICAAEA